MQDPFYPGDYFQNGEKFNPFHADGSISAFRLKNGIASYKQRYVYTERLIAERKAGKSMFGILGIAASHHPCVRALIDTTGNTNVILHNGKLLALMEAGPPFELDPNTLETIGHEPFPGELPPRQPFTAHPKHDPDTGNLIVSSIGISGRMATDFSVFEIDKNGKKIWERKGDAPAAGPCHDMILTPNYVVLLMEPLVHDDKDFLDPGKVGFFYDRDMPAWFGVISRKDPEVPIRWFKYKNCMNIHTGCAREEGSKLIFDCTQGHENVFPFIPYLNGKPGETITDFAVDYVRYTIDLKSTTGVMNPAEVLLTIPAEFPRTDERFTGKGGDITFIPCFKASEADTAVHQGLNALGRFTGSTGKFEIYDPGNCLVQEPAFVPRSEHAAEADGFVIVMVDNLDAGRNDLIIIDTCDFTKPVARIQIPLALRSAAHGNWIDHKRIPETEPFVPPLPKLYGL